MRAIRKHHVNGASVKPQARGVIEGAQRSKPIVSRMTSPVGAEGAVR
jgi:hypothetical protein